MDDFSTWINGLAVGLFIALMVQSCAKSAESATYGNDVSATSVVVATATAAGADSTKGVR